MNVYVETNFLLELVFEQEQCAAYASLLELATAREIQLIIPAYSLVEPTETLTRQVRKRNELQQNLLSQLRELSRRGSYQSHLSDLQGISTILTQSIETERKRLTEFRNQLIATATIVPLTAMILDEAAQAESDFVLSSQDAIVFCSVLTHLRQQTASVNCFLNRNTKDFGTLDIVEKLKSLNCRMIPQFDNGLAFIQSWLNP